jgi:hypothetical protein
MRVVQEVKMNSSRELMMDAKSVRSTFLMLAAALGLAGVVGTRPALAQADTVTTSVRIPLPQPFQVFVPCAAGGTGELVDLGGTLHVLFHTTLDGSGGFHAKTHFQPQGVTGIGLTTGDAYQGTGVNQDQLNGNVGEEYTLIDNFRIIGHGPGHNFLLHETLHTTVNANGVVTAFVSNVSVECK